MSLRASGDLYRLKSRQPRLMTYGRAREASLRAGYDGLIRRDAGSPERTIDDSSYVVPNTWHFARGTKWCVCSKRPARSACTEAWCKRTLPSTASELAVLVISTSNTAPCSTHFEHRTSRLQRGRWLPNAVLRWRCRSKVTRLGSGRQRRLRP